MEHDPYYAHHALVRLDRHVVVAGAMGSEAVACAHHLTALSGLTLHNIPRHVEHIAGMSTAQLLIERDAAALARLCAVAMRRSLAERPFGVIALGHLALSRWLRWTLPWTTRLIYVHRPFDATLRRVRVRRSKSPAVFPELGLGGVDVEALRARYEARERQFRRIALRVDAGTAPSLAVAQELLRIIARDDEPPRRGA